MGICCGKESVQATDILTPLREFIESHSVEEGLNLISQHFSAGQLIDINQPITQRSGVKINALTLSLLEGVEDIVIALLETSGIKVYIMKQQMLELGIVPIRWICERGYSKVLEHLMPFCKREKIQALCDENSTKLSEISNNLSTVHRACANGHANIVEILHEYYRYKDIPDDFNLHIVNKNTGENGALLSVTSGNLELVKMLFEKYHADFFQRDARNHASTQIALKYYLKTKNQVYIDIFKYLIEIVKVDFPQNIAFGNDSFEISTLRNICKQSSEPSGIVPNLHSDNEVPDESEINPPNCAEPWESLFLSRIPFITNPDHSISESSVGIINV